MVDILQVVLTRAVYRDSVEHTVKDLDWGESTIYRSDSCCAASAIAL